MIIDTTYFQGHLMIAQKNQVAISSNLEVMIRQCEDEFLQKILGYQLYKDFTAALTGTPAQKWIDLRDGKEFTDAIGQLNKWVGFKNTDKKSPIANYVYYKWMENEVSSTTGTGEKKMIFSSSVNYSPGQKMTRAWNEMVIWNRVLYKFLEVNKDVYSYYVFHSNELFYVLNELGI